MATSIRFISCVALIAATFSQFATAQASFSLSGRHACSYYGENITTSLFTFSSDSQAEQFVREVMDYTGLPQNFDIRAANVPNAAAVIEEQKRYILYSQPFMQEIVARTGTDWSATSIMAHEIGHHLAGHTLGREGSRPSKELEADRFSGHVLYKMGASLKEAKSAMERAASDSGSRTHPPKSARLAAIHNGWVAAKEQAGGPASSGSSSSGSTTRRRGPTPPPPPPTYNVEGRWQAPAGFVMVTNTGGGRYYVGDFNALGLQVGEGLGVLQGNNFSVRLTNLLGQLVGCSFTVSRSRMTGNCNGAPLSLSR